jgi:hypothetical protein
MALVVVMDKKTWEIPLTSHHTIFTTIENVSRASIVQFCAKVEYENVLGFIRTST